MVKSAESKVLANIVRHLKDQEDDPLSHLIDEYLIKRLQPEYRDRRLKSFTVDLETRMRPGGRLSPSSVCGCERQAALKFLGVEGRGKINPQTELIFEDGNWRHHKWGAFFLDMEKVLGRHRIRVAGIETPAVLESLFIAGHLDLEIWLNVEGKWIRYIVDFKGANNFSFEKAYRDRAPHPTYVRQLSTYMKARKCKRGILLYDSKDKNKLYVYVIKANSKLWAEVSNWCKGVLDNLENEKLPRKHPDCKNGTFMYGPCVYKHVCFGGFTDRQIQREVYLDFPGVNALWEKGHKEVEHNSGYDF